MKSLMNDVFPNKTPSWINSVEKLLIQKKKDEAIKVLNNVIENDLPLFQEYLPLMDDERRLAWLFKIDLLCEWKQWFEALAWTCLECETNPQNVSAKTRKTFLIQKVNQSRYDQETLDRNIHNDRIDWQDLVGMRAIKLILERDVIKPLLYPKLFKKYRIPPPNGVLFHGPPGCGKTFIARKISDIMNYTYFEMKPSDFGSIYIHGSQLKIKETFITAKEKSPSLIFIDEIDAMVPNRLGTNVNHSYKAEVGEILNQLDECGKSNILVIGATNFIENIDQAVIRPGRFDTKIFIGPPDLEARLQMFKHLMNGIPVNKINWGKVAEKLQSYTASDIKEVTSKAKKLAASEDRPINMNDIDDAINRTPPSLIELKNKKETIGFKTSK